MTSTGPSFFIAGTMQGSQDGIITMDQSYRAAIRTILQQRYPSAEIICPYEILLGKFAQQYDELARRFESLRNAETLYSKDSLSAIGTLIGEFQRLTRVAGEVDVLVAYLPNREPSMGTAMEMWSAFQRGRVIITISNMRNNLAILATSTVIIPSLAELPELLAGDWLSQQQAQRPR